MVTPDRNQDRYELRQLVVPAVAQWISCEAALPPERKDVLIHTKDGVRVGHLVRDTLSQKLVWDHRDDWRPLWQVTHWMPIPKLGKTDD